MVWKGLVSPVRLTRLQTKRNETPVRGGINTRRRRFSRPPPFSMTLRHKVFGQEVVGRATWSRWALLGTFGNAMRREERRQVHETSSFFEGFWRRRPDLNRGWRFCRPLPYHLATAPVGNSNCAGEFRAAFAKATAGQALAPFTATSIGVRRGSRCALARTLFQSPARGTQPAAKRRRSGARQAGPTGPAVINIGAGNGIRTRDFDLGKVALYH